MEEEPMKWADAAHVLRIRQAELDLTQPEIAEISGLTQPMISACLNGRSPAWETIMKLCDALQTRFPAVLILADLYRREREAISPETFGEIQGVAEMYRRPLIEENSEENS